LKEILLGLGVPLEEVADVVILEGDVAVAVEVALAAMTMPIVRRLRFTSISNSDSSRYVE